MVPDEQPLGIVVAITKTDVIVFSISALEGTLREPRLSLPLTSPDGPQKVSRLLEDIAKRRWGGKAKRAEHDLDIVVMADPATPMQKVAEVFGAVRASPNGTELFPRVRLSAGFE
jgi:hypothetical protein